jgi:PAS domain S-box-containing protein
MAKDERPRDASNDTSQTAGDGSRPTPAPEGGNSIYRMLVEHSLAGATVIQDGHYVYVNPAMAGMLGYMRDELLAVRPRDTVYEEDRTLVERNIGRRETGEAGSLRYTFRAKRKDGQIVHLELHGASAEFQGRRVALGAVLDITEQKRLERALQESEAEMRQARDEALSAARAKSTFLATMSHEIRTPMNAIIGMTDLLLETALSDTQRDFAETVRTAGEALLRIINDVLDYSKIEAGKFAIDAIDFDVRSTIEEVVGMLAEHAHQKS